MHRNNNILTLPLRVTCVPLILANCFTDTLQNSLLYCAEVIQINIPRYLTSFDLKSKLILAYYITVPIPYRNERRWIEPNKTSREVTNIAVLR